MAKRVHTEIVDDLDGQPGATAVTFAIEGTFYSIDLTPENQERLYAALEPFIAAATVDGGLRQYRTTKLDRANQTRR